MTEPERVQILDVDDYTEPAAEPGYYAIYLRLSHEPSDEWQACFQHEWQRIPTGLKRVATVVQNRIRIEIHGDDMLREQLDFGVDLVERANAAFAKTHQKDAKTHQKGWKENPARD